VCLGPAAAASSYLRVGTVVEAAVGTGCDAIHPGYGFLSEQTTLAEACTENDVIFVGPDPEHLTAVGDKLAARRHAEAAGVPVIPGSSVATRAEAEAVADRLDFPVLVKAAAGGGGRGMKRIDRRDQLVDQLDLAMAEAEAAFGDGRVYLERFVTVGRHIEVQILSDGRTVLQVGERDCSVQRRYQKLIEEAPAPAISEPLRQDLLAAAVRFARHIGYRSLGTVEFLVDVEREEFYFLEMNARIQVEHPVTEAISGLDLVAQQIAIAEEKPLELTQDDIRLTGHAIECRLNAEDPSDGFRPSPGRLEAFDVPTDRGPGTVRIDTHLASGDAVSPHYDSLVAKVIAHADTRAAAIETMKNALGAARIDGVATTLPLHLAVLDSDAFQSGDYDTASIPGWPPAGR
jgi:acetyl-CoA carboxylase biotin carboxylase subunit